MTSRYFVMELCDWTLVDYCLGLYKEITTNIVDALFQMASGLAFIHEREMIHGSIKPSNILIRKTAGDSQSVQFKISDFGIRCFWPESQCGNSRSVNEYNLLCPLYYIAAELLTSEDGIPANPSKFADAFALGCVFFNCLTKGKHPFGPHLFTIPIKITEGSYNLAGKVAYCC